ncbi:histidine phosphatase family protein [Parasulfitobacter algicola]|uniref:Histidine phosphatase family protein n=1 Tax=Parasulfitobacter algicola TaxID=2614809 RepID=A0ABX2IRP2_9RHOB|nr:histidine phosphatase family protein [Sulfitobacter algicola]NSX54980.1 histidine phosphatase family protein [Sulfitobacter algicola]
MVEITLVRHGQAQTGAGDEESYDRLSDLGRTQAQWLGQHFKATERTFDHMICGTLKRHIGTAKAIQENLPLEIQQDPRLNEMDYFGLAKSLEETHAVQFPTDRESFITHVSQILTVWQSGEIASHLETFEAFQTRTKAIIDMAENLGGRVLLVTSGGFIGMAMRILLQLEVRSYANVLLQIHNTSLHRYVKAGDHLVLDAFNAIPHLEMPDRAFARTYI